MWIVILDYDLTKNYVNQLKHYGGEKDKKIVTVDKIFPLDNFVTTQFC